MFDAIVILYALRAQHSTASRSPSESTSWLARLREPVTAFAHGADDVIEHQPPLRSRTGATG